MSNPRYEENIERLVNAHSDITTAILQKGGTVTQGDGFENFASDIATIPAGGTSDYTELSNKPQIGGVTLSGNKTASELGLQTEISDLSTIRSGASAGATALQQSDVSSTYSASGTAPVNGTAVKASMTGTLDSTDSNHSATSKAVADSQAEQDTEIAIIANAGAKSLLPIGVSSITYANAVTFSIANDGTITVNGTNPNSYAGIPYADLVTAKSTQLETRYTLPAGKYKITSTGDGLKFQVHCHDGTNASALFSGKSGGEFEYTSALKAQYPYICWRLSIDANASFSNQIVKPMIWNAEIKDSTFQPFALSNTALTEISKATDTEIAIIANAGAKSLLPIGVQSKDYSSTLSTTVDNEGIITVNGTRNDPSGGGILYQDLVTNKTRYQDTRYTLPVGTYRCKGSGTASLRLQVYCHDGTTDATQLFNSSEDGTFTYSQTQKQSKPYITFRLAIQPGNVSLNNHKVYPMIWNAEIKDSTFQPFALSNPVITPALINQVDGGVKNKLHITQIGSSDANVGTKVTSQGVEYEIQSDGTITAYRKTSSSSGAYIFPYENGSVKDFSEFFDGQHVWSGNPSQYPSTVAVWYNIGSGSNVTIPDGTILPNANGTSVRIGFQISSSESPTQSDPIVFKPMICSVSDWQVSQKFVPYEPKFVSKNFHLDLKGATWTYYNGFYYAEITGTNVESYFSYIYSIIPYWFSAGGFSGDVKPSLLPIIGNETISGTVYPKLAIRFMSNVDISNVFTLYQMKVTVFGMK